MNNQISAVAQSGVTETGDSKNKCYQQNVYTKKSRWPYKLRNNT